MAEQILVPMRRHDRIEEIIPYLEKVANPGMRVVFLFPYPVNSWLYLRDHWITTESPREAMLAGKKIMDRHSWEVQRGLAERKVFLASEFLQKKGVELAVDIYTGNLKRVIGDCASNQDVRLIMRRAGSNHPMMRLLRRVLVPFGLFTRPSFSPVLLHLLD